MTKTSSFVSGGSAFFGGSVWSEVGLVRKWGLVLKYGWFEVRVWFGGRVWFGSRVWFVVYLRNPADPSKSRFGTNIIRKQNNIHNYPA